MSHWVLAEFTNPSLALGAARRLKEGGARGIDLHSPYELEGAADLLELPPSPIPALVLMAGLGSAVLGFALQWFTNAVDLPLNVGGRPLVSTPAFIPATFELTILGASLTAFLGLLIAIRLPRLYHPVFEADRFVTCSIDRFWVSVPVGEERDARERYEAILREAGASRVDVVEERR